MKYERMLTTIFVLTLMILTVILVEKVSGSESPLYNIRTNNAIENYVNVTINNNLETKTDLKVPTFNKYFLKMHNPLVSVDKTDCSCIITEDVHGAACMTLRYNKHPYLCAFLLLVLPLGLLCYGIAYVVSVLQRHECWKYSFNGYTCDLTCDDGFT